MEHGEQGDRHRLKTYEKTDRSYRGGKGRKIHGRYHGMMGWCLGEWINILSKYVKTIRKRDQH